MQRLGGEVWRYAAECLPATRIERPISESKGAQPVVFRVQNEMKRSYRTITVPAVRGRAGGGGCIGVLEGGAGGWGGRA